jgi:hypothetical protein
VSCSACSIARVCQFLEARSTSGRVAGCQAKRHDEMQAVADAVSLLVNIVMAGNTMKMQLVLDRWNTRCSTAVPAEADWPHRAYPHGRHQSARRV